MERLAMLGRLSAQMAHDLKNPLTAIKGALQYLKEERRQGRSIDGEGEFLDLMETDVDRLTRLIDKYRRLGSVEPVRTQTDLNGLVGGVLGLQQFASTRVEIRQDLDKNLPNATIDQDLVATALENLIQNALEAMPKGGVLTVRTERIEHSRRPYVAITVADNGEGMDARRREQVFDEFFTTKATGSGLGLTFVRRVAEAHGGDVQLESGEGKGTRVRLRLALASRG
jgi:signal transduction histidine kinase